MPPAETGVLVDTAPQGRLTHRQAVLQCCTVSPPTGLVPQPRQGRPRECRERMPAVPTAITLCTRLIAPAIRVLRLTYRARRYRQGLQPLQGCRDHRLLRTHGLADPFLLTMTEPRQLCKPILEGDEFHVAYLQ